MKNSIKKLTSLSLGLAIMFGALSGIYATTTEASPRHDAPWFDAGDPPPAPHHHHHVEKPGDPPPAR